ncbi:MAG: hypothetical protein WDW36_002057 [Sanguina aurantia]
MMRAGRKQELQALVIANTRQFVAPLRIEFSDEVVPSTKTSHTVSVLEEWKGKKQSTEHLIKLLHTYKDLGDAKNEPYLKFHNPKSFEDMGKAVPNFRSLALRSGELPKFFDGVLSRRAEEAVEKKSEWWAARKQEAEAALSAKKFATLDRHAETRPPSGALLPLPVPSWQLNKPLSLAAVAKVTDSYLASLQPARKLKLPVLPEAVQKSLTTFAASLGQAGKGGAVTDLVAAALADKAVVEEGGKVLADFTYVTKTMAARAVAARRAEVHDRYLKAWAKKLIVAPEVAAVPLKEVDAQLASKFEGVAPKYNDLLQAVATGSATLSKRLSTAPVMSSFFLRRDVQAIQDDLPPSELEVQGAELAARLEDPATAMTTLLGPELHALGAGGQLLSKQVAELTEHKYSSDRYMYKEGMKLAARYAAEEAALKEELKGAHGESVDVAHFQAHPRTPVQQLADRVKEVDIAAAGITAQLTATDSPYLKDVLAKRLEALKDLGSIAFDEVLYPELNAESLAIELAECDEAEARIDDAEEEELWMLTLTQQFKHISKHFGVDLPHSVLSYMDPVLTKKIDYETTHGLDDWDQTLDDLASEYAKQQWGSESLSHHFLPLLRYRRAKARKAAASFEPEVSTGRVHT